MHPYSPGAVANYFLEKSWVDQPKITPMHLQKLMYFANGWYMAFYNDDKIVPLINEPFQAWEYGPVCGSVYHEFKGFGNNPITKNYFMKEAVVIDELKGYVELKVNQISSKLEEDKATAELLDKVWERYATLSASELSKMTHKEDPDNPWKKAKENAKKEGIVRGKEISNKDIKEYFKKLIAENKAY